MTDNIACTILIAVALVLAISFAFDATMARRKAVLHWRHNDNAARTTDELTALQLALDCALAERDQAREERDGLSRAVDFWIRRLHLTNQAIVEFPSACAAVQVAMLHESMRLPEEHYD